MSASLFFLSQKRQERRLAPPYLYSHSSARPRLRGHQHKSSIEPIPRPSRGHGQSHPIQLPGASPSRPNRSCYLPSLTDPFPMDAKLIDRRLASNDVWAVDQELQTFFLATKIEPGKRRQAWHQLTTPGLGVAGEVSKDGSEFEYSAGGLCSMADLEPNTFQPGPAVFKLVPVGDDYASQPTSASAAASYVLNNWRLVVEQDGKQLDKYTTLAQYVDFEDMQGLEHIAELASAENGPGRIIYAQRPYWYSEKVCGVGVRLRDGGSRFHLDKIDDTKAEFQLPADRFLHSKWGRFDGKDIGPELHSKTPVMAQLRIPTGSQAQDVIFRTNDSDEGDFHRLEYALRPRGSCKAIKADEWKPVDCSILDEWIICFFCNIAKVTWGCLNRDLVRPSSASVMDDQTVQPPQGAAGDQSADGGKAEGSASSARDKKKPRLA